MVTASPFVYLFSCKGFCTQSVQTYLEFQFMTTVFVSRATRSSDLEDFEPETKIQTEGHTLTPTNSQNGQENPEAFGSVPSCSPSQSPARKPTPDSPETQYCLEIHVKSTEDDMAIPPPPHTWQATNCGRHGLGRQNWPNRSCSDQPRTGCSVLWTAIIRRRTEHRWGERHHIHIIRSHCLGW